MSEILHILEDELPLHIDRLKNIEDEIKQQWKEKELAFSQWETFHDNPAWEQVEMEQKMSSGKLAEIKSIINKARVITFDILKKSPEDIVSIGKKVTLLINDEEKEYIIWGYHTPIKWRISYEAPLAKSILWKEEWEEVEFKINWNSIIVEIISVSRLS